MCPFNADTSYSMRELAGKFSYDENNIRQVTGTYPMKVNPYYLGLIRGRGDGIWRQCIPDIREVTMEGGEEDPLREEVCSPVPGLTHRYPDRLLLLISADCAMYCRFCTRKRRLHTNAVTVNLREACAYIREHPEVRDVLLSGGDPLMLSVEELEYYIARLRGIKQVEIIRIGTRVPCVAPGRVTGKLCSMLAKYHPLYMNVHFNHPGELTVQAEEACASLADAGIPLGNQSVLLRDVNDNPLVMKKLVLGLLKMRVRPYYIFLPDNVKGTRHFRTGIAAGLRVIDALRGWITGLAVPQLVIDLNGGGGKVPLLPEYLIAKEGHQYIFRNYRGDVFRYGDV